MAFKAISVLSDADRSNWKPALCDDGVGDEIRVEGLTELAIPSATGERYGSLEPHDYHIALMPRLEREPSAGMLRLSAVSRVFLLPLTWQELVARMRSELRSGTLPNLQEVSRFGEVRVNFLTIQVTKLGQPVLLTAQQFKLLKFLMQTPERVYSRDELLEKVWGYNHYPSTRTVDNHIWSLRQKLELSPERPIHFLTVRGIGYKFAP